MSQSPPCGVADVRRGFSFLQKNICSAWLSGAVKNIYSPRLLGAFWVISVVDWNDHFPKTGQHAFVWFSRLVFNSYVCHCELPHWKPIPQYPPNNYYAILCAVFENEVGYPTFQKVSTKRSTTWSTNMVEWSQPISRKISNGSPEKRQTLFWTVFRHTF